jgi:TrmH family RNA methyltransferase
MAPTRLAHIVVVLYEPQDPVNIAATVRAMANMGIAELRLVRPVEYDPNLIEVVAHDTRPIVGRIRQADDLDAALSDCVDVIGYTARRRAAKRPVLTPRAAAARGIERAGAGPVALLFGREDHGLPNAALDRAHAVATIPTTTHASLNLAQAVMIALYEVHLAAAEATRQLAPPRHDAPPATSDQYEQLFADAERALRAIDFFKTRFAEHVLRSLRSLTFRAAPDAREITLMRAVAIEVLRTLDRTAIIPRED